MRRDEINIRDPFILAENGWYYLYGTRGATTWSGKSKGFDVYLSQDLNGEWDGPYPVLDSEKYGLDRRENWAPEVVHYGDSYYLFATFRQDTDFRGTFILRSDSPKGPFVPHSEGAITPRDWHSLDGTFYVDPQGKPYMVFSHEWVQIRFGTIEAIPLSEDLRRPAGEPVTLIESKKASWVKPSDESAVTDGPFLYRKEDGTLLMIWSSLRNGYITAVYASDNGDVTGNWKELPGLLFQKDGGHGMIFRALDGQLMLTLHSPNATPQERPFFLPLREDPEHGIVCL